MDRNSKRNLSTTLKVVIARGLQNVQSFDVSDWQPDVGGAKRLWWLETFEHQRVELLNLIEKILSEARFEQDGCLCFPQPRKRVTWRKRTQYAYELVAYALNGELPTNNSVIRHICNNSRCVHPDHLRIGTQRENVGDEALRRSGRFN